MNLFNTCLKHRKAFTNAAILHHYDDNVDLLYNCNVFVFLFSVSGLSSLKERIFQRTPFSGCFQI